MSATRYDRILAAMMAVSALAPALVGAAITLRDGPFSPGVDVGIVAGSILGALLFGFAPALMIVVVIMLPVYLILSRWWPMRWWHAALAGALMGGALALLGGIHFGELAVMGLIGLSCGLVFRAVVGRDPREARA